MTKTLDLRVRKTYHSLHKAFTELLADQHFEDFTVNELCERAMIRRTTFYKHFSDKQDYFTFYLQEVCGEFQKQVANEHISGNFSAYCTKMTELLLDFLRKNQRLVQNITESNMFPLLLNILQNFIAEEILRILRAHKEFQTLPEYQLEGLSAFYSGGLLNTLFLFLKKEPLSSDKDFINVVAPFLHIYA